MASYSVAVVDAKTPGNIGTIARAMKNFGLSDLYLVDPPELDPDGEAYGFAGQAREDILPNAQDVSFDFLVENFFTVGTTALTSEDGRRSVRYPYVSPRTLAGELAEVDTDVCLVFGRERVGLHNEELARLDRVCTIPASAEYPVLNLGQAATVLMYELRELTVDGFQTLPDIDRAPEADIEGLYDQFATFMQAIPITETKRPRTNRAFRRLIARAHPTTREVSLLRGVVRRAEDELRGAGRRQEGIPDEPDER